MLNRRAEYLVWVGVVSLYALVTLPMLLRYPPIWPDEVLFMSPSDSLARGAGMGTEVLAGFIPGIELYTFWLPPGYFITLAGLFLVFGPAHHLLVMRLLSWVLGLVLLGASWITLRRLTSQSWIIWPSLMLLATHPAFVRAANLGRMEMLTLVCIIISAYFYLRFLDAGEGRLLAAAGFLGGVACLYHPAGAVILAALALHRLATSGVRALAIRETYFLFGSVFIPIAVWLIYILRAPHLFFVQFGGQFTRKVSHTGLALVRGTVFEWLLRPLQFPYWSRELTAPMADCLPVSICLVAILLLILPARKKAEGWVLGLWMLAGFALNLFTLEQWYPIYFILPTILVVGWGGAMTHHPWARTLGVLTLIVGIGWNLGQAAVLFRGPDGGWSDYKRYTSILATQIPPGSRILLMAVPDPYFGLWSEKKAYRFYEFVPEGIPVSPAPAEKALASIDYVVDSGCCSPGYVLQYVRSHGTLVGGAMSPNHSAPPVRIWKLRRP